jgi:hypothetical protein
MHVLAFFAGSRQRIEDHRRCERESEDLLIKPPRLLGIPATIGCVMHIA